MASAVPVANGYVNAAFRTGGMVAADTFLGEAGSFFAEVGSPYVVWADDTDDETLDVAVATGGVADARVTPAMSVSDRTTAPGGVEVRAAVDAHGRASFGRLCEDGYDIAGLAWLLDSQRCSTRQGRPGPSPVSAAPTSAWGAASPTARPAGSTTSPHHPHTVARVPPQRSRRG